MTVTFCLILFIPREIHSERSGLNFVPYSILKYERKNYRSVIFSVKETISPFLSFLYWGAFGSKCVKSSEPDT